ARPVVLAGKDQVVHLPVGVVATLLAGTAGRLVRLLRLGVDTADGVILEDVAYLPGVDVFLHLGHRLLEMAPAERALVVGILDDDDRRVRVASGGRLLQG